MSMTTSRFRTLSLRTRLAAPAYLTPLLGHGRVCGQFAQTYTNMPKCVIEREIPGAANLSDAQWREIAQKSVSVLKGMGPEIQWLHSYVAGDKVYCVYLAPDETTIQEHAKRSGFPANRVTAVRRLIDPSSA